MDVEVPWEKGSVGCVTLESFSRDAMTMLSAD